MKNVIRKITTWLLVFGMTFTPVLTSIDTVMANAGEETITITVGGENKDFNNGNLSSETISTVNETSDVNAKAAEATTAAAEAATAADNAKLAAEAAKTAADSAAEIAQAAADVQSAFAALTVEGVEGTGAVAINNAAGTVTNAETGAKALVEAAQTAVTAATTAEGEAAQAVTDANTAINNYNTQVGNANTAIATANEYKGTPKQEDPEKKDATGTYAKIQDAEDYLQNTVKVAEQTAKDNYVTQGEIDAVKQAVSNAEAAYQTANSDALDGENNENSLKKINDTLAEELKGLYTGEYIAENVTGAASDAKTEAEKQEGKAKQAMNNAEGFYNQITSMAANDAFDLELAAALVTNTEQEATNAETAARLAQAAADSAAAAETLAKGNLDRAEAAVANALAALQAAKAAYETAYNAAEAQADAADNQVNGYTDGQGEEHDGILTRIATANDKITEANTALNNYQGADGQGGKVKTANDAIDETNRLIGLAQDEIDQLGLDYKEKNKNAGLAYEKDAAITNATEKMKLEDENGVNLQTAAGSAVEKAGQAIEAAVAALDAAQKALDDAKSAYDAAVEESKTAAELATAAEKKWRAIVGEAYDEEADEPVVGGLLKDVQDKAAIAVAAANLSKDTLAKMTNNGEDYEKLSKDYNGAADALSTANGLLDAAIAEQARVDGEQDPIISQNQEIINSNSSLLGSKTTEGSLYKQQNDIDTYLNQANAKIEGYTNTITTQTRVINELNTKTIPAKQKAYEDAKKDQEDAQAAYDALEWYDWTYGKGEVVWIKLLAANSAYSSAEKALNDAKTDLETAERTKDEAQTSKENLENSDTYKNAKDAKLVIDANVLAAETAIKNATTAQNNARSKKTEAANAVTAKREDVQLKTSNLQAAKEKKDRVDNFVFTDNNTLVVDLNGLTEDQLNAKLKEIAALLGGYGSVEDLTAYKNAKNALNADYGPGDGGRNDYSYKTLDGNTTEYKGYMGADIWLFGIDWGPFEKAEEIKKELNLEKKFGAHFDLLDTSSWDDFFAVSDDDWHAVMKAETNGKCVIVCTDIDKLSTLRATFANEKAELALSEANVAAAAAKAAKERAATAKTNEENALASFNAAQAALNEAKNILYGYTDADGNQVPGLVAPTYPAKTAEEIGTLDEVTPLDTLATPFNTKNNDPNNDYVKTYEDDIPVLITEDMIASIKSVARLSKIDLSVLIQLLPTKNDDGEWEYGQQPEGNWKEELTADLEEEDKELVLNLIEKLQEAADKLGEAQEAYESAKQDHVDAQAAADRAAAYAKRARWFANAASALLDANTPGGTGEGGDTTGSAPATSGPVLIPLTGGTTPSGVAGVRVAAAGEGEGTGEGTAPADNTVAKNNTSTIEETELPGAAEAPSTNLKDTDLPGAQGATDNEANLWWLWAAIAVLLALGFGVYKYVDNKKKAENTIQK